MPGLGIFFDILAKDSASPAFAKAGASAESSGKRISGFGKALGLLAVADVGFRMVKSAADFQRSTNIYQTASGETAAGLKLVRAGILDIANSTGTSTHQLTEGMLLVQRASFHGADSLKVLTAAAQGAKEENANLDTVVTGMTSVMASYNMKADDSVRTMNALKTATGLSKGTLQDFTGSLSTVVPIASAAGISFDQVAGAIATMTQHGTSAFEATQELANTIRNLQAPNNVAVQAMGQLGISATDVSRNLGKRGLTGTLDYLVTTITSKMGPSGLVLMNSFKQSQTAGQDVQRMLAGMDPTVRKLADSYIAGSITQKDWAGSLKSLTPLQANLARQFAVTENRAKGFNDNLRRGGPAAVTFTKSVKDMTGGANGLNTTLMLTGGNMAGFKDRVGTIGKSLHDSSTQVEGWASTLGLASTQADMAKQRFATLGIQFGTVLLPSLVRVTGGLISLLGFIQRNQETIKPLLVVVGSLAAGIYLWVKATKAVVAVQGAWTAVMALSSGTLGTYVGVQFLVVTAKVRDLALTGYLTVSYYANAAAQRASAAATWVGVAASRAWSAVTRGAAAVQAAWSAAVAFSTGTLGPYIAALFTESLAKARSLAMTGYLTASYFANAVAQRAAAVASKVWAAGQWLLNAALTANPIGLVVVAIAALVGGFIYAYKHSETFRKIVQGAMRGVEVAFHSFLGVAQGVFGWIGGHWKLLLAIITGPIGAAAIYVIGHFGQIRATVQSVFGAITGVISRAGSAVGSVARGIGTAFVGARIVAVTALGVLVRTVEGVPGRIVSVFSGAGSWLLNAGRNIVGGLISGVGDMIRPLQDRFSSITNMIPSWKGPASRDAVLLRPSAHLIMGGLIGGIAEREGALRSGLGRVTGIVAGTAMPGFGGFGSISAGALARSANAQAGAALGGDTHVHLHFDGAVLSDDARAFAAKVTPHIREALVRDAGRNNLHPKL